MEIKLKYFLPVCLTVGWILLMVESHEINKLRHVLPRPRSHPPDVFRDQFLAMRGTDKPLRSTRKPYATIGFKINHSRQQLTSNPSIDMRQYPNTADDYFERDYSGINDNEINLNYKEDGPSASFRPYIPDNLIRSYLPWDHYQQEKNFLPPQDTRMWPGANSMRNFPIICNCNTNLGGIWMSHPNEIQPRPVPSYKPPPAHPVFKHQKPESGLPHYPISSQPPRIYQGGNHFNPIDFHGPTTERIQASGLNKPYFTTIRPWTTVTPSTRDESANAVKRVLT